jgi:hypothetical protein
MNYAAIPRPRPFAGKVLAESQVNRYLVQLDFISFIKFSSLSFCCANTLFSPPNAFYTFQNSGMGKALLVLLLAPFAGLLLGVFFGVLAFPLYTFLTTRSQFLASLSGRFKEVRGEADQPSDGGQPSDSD